MHSQNLLDYAFFTSSIFLFLVAVFVLILAIGFYFKEKRLKNRRNSLVDLNINWEIISKNFNYVALDADGFVFAFEFYPVNVNGLWVGSPGEKYVVTYVHPNLHQINYKKEVLIRPYYNGIVLS